MIEEMSMDELREYLEEQQKEIADLKRKLDEAKIHHHMCAKCGEWVGAAHGYHETEELRRKLKLLQNVAMAAKAIGEIHGCHTLKTTHPTLTPEEEALAASLDRAREGGALESEEK